MATETVETDDPNEDILATARKDYERAREAWKDNQTEAEADLKFARLGGDYQWVGTTAETRRLEGRPAESFNKMPAFIRQVVNDARQNKPQIKVHPQDSKADPRVAEIYNGLIRNIETTSDADVAYDTAVEQAVGQGFGFWRINTKYTCDDTFEQDIVIERVTNPFTVYGDPRSTAADSSDWNVAFIITMMSKDEFEREYPDAEKTDWDFDFKDCPGWLDGDDVVVAEYWTREKVKDQVVALSDGTVRKISEVEKFAEQLAMEQVTPVGEPREIESYKVTQYVLTGAEVLKTVEWAGRYIPIVPVYGDEVIDEHGKRHFRSLIRDAKGSQRMYNYMRNTGIEGLGLQPRVPYIGEEGSFDVDSNWSTANQVSHPYLEYKKGTAAPQRQPLPSHFGAAFQEALTAADDMKSIIGIYDASLGARSNETSGRAIMARQREGDVSTFHFIDNLSRAIRHGGRILLDLIPKVYTTERIIRVLGEDFEPRSVSIAPTGQPVQPQPPQRPEAGAAMAMPPGPPNGPMPPAGAAAMIPPEETADPMALIYDLTVGKYDLTVKAGPSFTTMREENRLMMMEAMQAGGEPTVPVLLPRIAKLMDMPDSETIASEIEQRMNPQPQGGIPPELQQEIQQGMQRLQQLEAENQQLKAGNALKAQELELKAQENQIKGFEAETDRMKAMQPTFVKPMPAPGATQ